MKTEAAHMLEEAERCRRLAAKIEDRTASGSLQELAAWYQAKAQELLARAGH